jgi:hypothetical protein
MGLLDDAIREHLELKRLRGADPSDVAREEDAALGPVHRRDTPESDAPPEDLLATTTPEESRPLAADVPAPRDSSPGQETVEINMEAELAESDPEQTPTTSTVPTTPAAHTSSGRGSSGESLEWEMPGDRRDDPKIAWGDGHEDEDIGSGSESKQGVDAPIEDVLEETPDFLRDTPEQDRLWFEQRPPRDFDFNE